MGREITRVEETVWYVPDLEDNRTDTDPFAVLLEPMNGAELKKAERVLGRYTRGEKINPVRKAQLLRSKVIAERVKEVQAYSVRQKSTGEVFRPKDGKELLQAVEMAGGAEVDLVLDEIWEALTDHSKLADGLLEPSRSRSDSSSAGTASVSAGDAQNAGGQNERAQTSTTEPGVAYATATDSPMKTSSRTGQQVS